MGGRDLGLCGCTGHMPRLEPRHARARSPGSDLAKPGRASGLSRGKPGRARVRTVLAGLRPGKKGGICGDNVIEVDRMDLFRLYGFAIDPQRLMTDDEFVDPPGGQLQIRATLRNALDRSLKNAFDSNRLTQVTLNVDTEPEAGRSSPIRDAVRELALSPRSPQAAVGAAALAAQLSKAMDERSPDCLFLAAAYREDGSDDRQVALWIFPQDEAFRFSPTQHDIELLTDIFSRTSGLRKMALFRGQEGRTHFLNAQVLDYQTGRADDVARFWIERFLDAELAITPKAGTRLLADALKRASDADLTAAENRQVHAAAVALHSMPTAEWSLEQVANQFLSGKARESFLATADNDETRTSVFRIDHDTLSTGLAYRSFQLPNKVLVSAPIDEVGSPDQDKTVQLEEQPEGDDGAPAERLRIEADVIEDRLTGRRRA